MTATISFTHILLAFIGILLIVNAWFINKIYSGILFTLNGINKSLNEHIKEDNENFKNINESIGNARADIKVLHALQKKEQEA